jgi:hypothetical protein
MADDGRRDLPRPPRRIPSWASADETSGPRTTIQPRANPSTVQTVPNGPPYGPNGSPVPTRLRFRFLIPLVVFVLVVGAGAGWLVREQSLSLDTDEILQTSGRTVVRVLATTCGGSGQAAGVLLGDGIVLTAASAIRQPVSVGFLTSDGRVRRANVLGVNTDGIAVLRMIGRLDNPTAILAPKLPDQQADRAIIGYDAGGDQFAQQAGTTEKPRKLTEILGGGSLGAPMFDPRGRMIGLVTGDTVASSKVVPLDALRQYAGTGAPIIPEPVGTCQARGPQAPVEPDLSVANTPLAGEVQQTLGAYLDALNKHDFVAMGKTYSDRLAKTGSPAVDAQKHATSYAFDAVITEVSAAGGDNNANARMTFTVLFSPRNVGAGGQYCARFDLRYTLIREQQRLRIDNAVSMSSDQSCDTDG